MEDVDVVVLVDALTGELRELSDVEVLVKLPRVLFEERLLPVLVEVLCELSDVEVLVKLAPVLSVLVEVLVEAEAACLSDVEVLDERLLLSDVEVLVKLPCVLAVLVEVLVELSDVEVLVKVARLPRVEVELLVLSVTDKVDWLLVVVDVDVVELVGGPVDTVLELVDEEVDIDVEELDVRLVVALRSGVVVRVWVPATKSIDVTSTSTTHDVSRV